MEGFMCFVCVAIILMQIVHLMYFFIDFNICGSEHHVL